MTVEAIRLQNFMAFEDTDWLELKPISLLFGRNSSGKSAIIRALLLLKQSVNSSLETGPLTFVTKAGIDQGSFKETVHKKHEDEAENRNMIFSFRCSLEKEPILDQLRKRLNPDQIESWQPDIKLDNLKWVDICVGFTWNADKQKADPTMVRLDLPFQKNQTKDQSSPVIFAYEKLDYYTANELGEGEWFWSDILQVSKEYWPSLTIQASARGFWPTFANSDTMASHALSIDFKFLTDLLELGQTKVESFLKAIQYLGPIRPQPERIFTIDRWTGFEWRQRGMGAFLDFLANQVDADTLEKLDEWLRHLELGQEINVERARSISGFDAMCQVMMHESLEAKFNIKDIGFGASQVLPVVLQSLLANPGALVIIEQPELHLHPSAQADLADVFVKRIYEPHNNEENLDNNKFDERKLNAIEGSDVRFLIETHSVNLINRLRRRLAETARDVKRRQLPQLLFLVSDLAAYFISRRGSLSSIEKIAYDQTGAYEKQPEGFIDFFGNDYHELRAMSEARREALKNEEGA